MSVSKDSKSLSVGELLDEAIKHTDQPKSSKTKTASDRRFSGVTYIHPAYLINIFKQMPISHYSFAMHDKDLDDKGESKMLHTHFIVYFYNQKTESAVRKLFDRYSKEYYPDNPQNTLVQICNNPVGAYRYFRHLDDPDKYQYGPDIIKCDDDLYWSKLCKTDGLNDAKSNIPLQIFDALLRGVRVEEMIMLFGNQYVYHARQYQYLLERYKMESELDDDIDQLLARSYFDQKDINTFNRVLDYLKRCYEDHNEVLTFYLHKGTNKK